jgi:Na+-driven multidrug efflux pump
MPAFAVSMAVSAMTVQNIGAGKWDRVPRIARVGVLCSVLLTGSVVLAIEVLDTRIFSLILPAGSNALAIASHMNRIVTGSFMFFGVSVTLFGVVRATGAVMAPLIVLPISLLAVRFPVAELFLERYQVDAVWWSFPLSSVLSTLLALLYYKYGGWRSAHMLITGPAARS